MADVKRVYTFGNKEAEGNGKMRELLGGKGANLAEMTNLGMPVPQGFTVTTEACTRYYEDGQKIAKEIEEEIYEYLAKMEQICGAFSDCLGPETKKYVCAPCSNCKGQIRELLEQNNLLEKNSIRYGGLVELIVNAMTNVNPGFIEFEGAGEEE